MKNKTTGEVAALRSTDVPTVCMPNEGLELSITGAYREKERKLWAFLVHYAYENLGKQRRHKIECSTVTHIFRSITGCGRTKDLWEYVENLGNIKIKWEKEGNTQGFARLLSFAEVNHDKGTIEFEIPSYLEDAILKSNYQFARLRTHFLIGLSGKYSVTLYLLLETYANRQFPVLTLSIDELREKLSIEQDKLQRWQDLRRRVIEPAIKEINEKTIQECESSVPSQHGAGFTVEYEVIKKSRKVVGVKFTVVKHKKRIEWEFNLKKPKKDKPKVIPLISLNWEKVKNIARANNLLRKVDIYSLEKEWRKWLWDTGRCDNIQDPEGSYVGFIKKKLM